LSQLQIVRGFLLRRSTRLAGDARSYSDEDEGKTLETRSGQVVVLIGGPS